MERDLSAHLETALRGVVLVERWPKSSLEIMITILEGQEDQGWGNELEHDTGVTSGDGMHATMLILSGCITVASAAIIHAGIDCLDIASGGVAALVPSFSDADTTKAEAQVVLDPSPREHQEILAICTVGYLKTREEITEVWMYGSVSPQRFAQSAIESLVDGAVQAATASAIVVQQAVK